MTTMNLPSATRLRMWLLGALLLWAGTAVQAQDCWNSGTSNLNFGTVAVGNTADTTGDVQLTCQANWLLATQFRVCVYAAGYPTSANVNPRLMSNNNSDGQGEKFMPYNLFSNAARTSVLGPEGSNAYAAYVLNFSLPAASTQATNIPIYGRVTATAGLPGGQTFFAYNNGVTAVWSSSVLGSPASCDYALLARGTVNYGLQTQATTSNSCVVSIASASDLDFGTYSSLNTARLGTSTIALNCPGNTSWRVGLNNGLTPQGTQRRMAGPGTDYISYELYRDAARSQRWGNDTAGGSDTVNGTGSSSPAALTVYGRVPAQAEVRPGLYSDTITVTLTY